MKRFLKKWLMFLLTVYLVAIPLDIFISYRLRHCDARIFKAWNDIYNQNLKNDIVINGSSRAYVHYDPAILDSVLNVDSYNLGMSGSYINRQILKYKVYCKLHGNPKYLIQNIDWITLRTGKDYEREQYFPFFFYDREMMTAFDKYEKFLWAEKWLPCFRYVGYSDIVKSTMGMINLGSDEVLKKGYCGRSDSWDSSEFAKFAYRDSIYYKHDESAIKLFEDFLKEVISSGTKVILVHAPIYVGVIEKTRNLSSVYADFYSISSTFDIPFLDYSRCYIGRDTLYFYNATHMNKIGAELFSTLLAHDIDSLELLQ